MVYQYEKLFEFPVDFPSTTHVEKFISTLDVNHGIPFYTNGYYDTIVQALNIESPSSTPQNDGIQNKAHDLCETTDYNEADDRPTHDLLKGKIRLGCQNVRIIGLPTKQPVPSFQNSSSSIITKEPQEVETILVSYHTLILAVASDKMTERLQDVLNVGWKFEKDWTTSYGRIAFSTDAGAGKRRLFAIGNYVLQRALKPLNDFLMRSLKAIPMDGTFNQTRPLDKLKGNSSATDRWPLLIQTRMVERLFDKKLGDYVHNRALSSKTPKVPSSWPLFTLSHHLVIWYCAQQRGVPWR
ncbi:hypothetical protein Lal_00002326 [Lupinus albus]|nr:hypothetical protein Lal_00002326 [Lupinus albus]